MNFLKRWLELFGFFALIGGIGGIVWLEAAGRPFSAGVWGLLCASFAGVVFTIGLD